MGVSRIPASKLVIKKPNAECCDCCKQPDETSEDIWVIGHNGKIRCPKCAAHENIGHG